MSCGERKKAKLLLLLFLFVYIHDGNNARDITLKSIICPLGEQQRVLNSMRLSFSERE